MPLFLSQNCRRILFELVLEGLVSDRFKSAECRPKFNCAAIVDYGRRLLLLCFFLILLSAMDRASLASDSTLNIGSSETVRVAEKKNGEADDDDKEPENFSVPKERKYVRIPILYMTDRSLNEDESHSFGNQRNPETDSLYDVFCGNASVSLENHRDKSPNEVRNALGWSFQEKDEEPSHTFLDGKVSAWSNLDRFAEEIKKVCQKTGKNEICIFVHGFKNTFDGAATKAARLSYAMEMPVLLYSWPSRAKLFQYIVDTGNNEWSQEHFNRLEEKLYELKTKHGLKVILVAHSMGNRLVMRSAPILEDKQLFDQVFLVDPDLDSQTFLHYVARYVHKKILVSHGKMRILFSTKDNALPFAQKLFGGYTRLGQGADAILESFFNPKNMLPALIDAGKSVLDTDNLNFRWLLGADNKDGTAANLFLKDIDWIDFSILDHGIIGHSVPFRLIANLAETSKPGEGLELVDEEVAVANFKSKMFKKMFGKGAFTNKNPWNLGICKKVQFIDDSLKSAKDGGILLDKQALEQLKKKESQNN